MKSVTLTLPSKGLLMSLQEFLDWSHCWAAIEYGPDEAKFTYGAEFDNNPSYVSSIGRGTAQYSWDAKGIGITLEDTMFALQSYLRWLETTSTFEQWSQLFLERCRPPDNLSLEDVYKDMLRMSEGARRVFGEYYHAFVFGVFIESRLNFGRVT